MKKINLVSYISVFGNNLRLNFFEISKNCSEDINQTFASVSGNNNYKIDLEINFYNLKYNRNVELLKNLLQQKDNIVCLKTKHLVNVYNSKELRAYCFYKDIGRLVNAVVFTIDNILLRLQRQLRFLFLHSAAVICNNKGYIFIAASKGGKTTIANLARKNNLKVLSDEVSFVKHIRNSFYLYPYPLESQDLFNIKYKIKRLFFLKKGKYFRFRRLSKIESLAKGIPESLSLYGKAIPEIEMGQYREYVIGFLERLFKKIPPFELEFKKDDLVFSKIGLN